MEFWDLLTSHVSFTSVHYDNIQIPVSEAGLVPVLIQREELLVCI